jgi:hypothetical protein
MDSDRSSQEPVDHTQIEMRNMTDPSDMETPGGVDAVDDIAKVLDLFDQFIHLP